MRPPKPGEQVTVVGNDRASLILECYSSPILGIMYRTRIVGPGIYIKGGTAKDFNRALREGLEMFRGWRDGAQGW